jgi:hypothetical protein
VNREVAQVLGPGWRDGRWTRLGVVLVAVSVVLWVLLPVIPFLPLSAEFRVGLGVGVLIGAEITFWAGAALAGPEALKRLKGWWRVRMPGLSRSFVRGNQGASGSPVSIGSDSSRDHSPRDPS